MDIKRIESIMPHRFPFLLIDEIEYIKEEEISAVKNVSFNEPFFQGHFPGNAIMPGVLITEAIVQTGVYFMLAKEEFKGKIAYLTDIEKAKFRKNVVPGDTLKIVVQVIKINGNIGKFSGKIYVKDKMCASALFTLFVK